MRQLEVGGKGFAVIFLQGEVVEVSSTAEGGALLGGGFVGGGAFNRGALLVEPSND